MRDPQQTNWWRYADEPIRDLVGLSLELLASEKNKSEYKYHDYAFVVFPAAKAYEGFLKKLFLDMGLISEQQYSGDYFRIGKVLNPNLPKRYRSGWVYGKLVETCGGDGLPLRMWQVWSRARNKIFHFFPHHREFIALPEAEELLNEIISSMEETLTGCGVK